MLFASYNIQYGTGKDGRVDLARIADAVKEADVIALQEVERHWPRTGDVDQVAALAAALPGRYWVYGPGLDMHADGGAPGSRRRQFGNMLLSRTPIVSSRHHLLPKFGATKQYCLQRSAIEGVIETPGFGPIRVYSLHLSHLGDGDRAAQVEKLLAIHRDAPSEGGAWCGHREGTDWTLGQPEPPMPAAAVFMGDFNLAADSPLYERLAGPMSNEYGRMTARSGLVDAWVAAGNAEDSGTTADSHAGRRFARIDYCFASAALASRVRKAWIDGKAVGSDHQPIWTAFDL
jgi:endonuclease/exonuclease/phosphatase family metal-dependent hydrolase